MTVSNELLVKFIENPNENGPTIIEMAKELLAHRKAFSEPVAFTAKSNLDGFGGSVGYMWPPGNEKPTDVALYRKPNLTE